MPRFPVLEVWLRLVFVEAEDDQHALSVHEPEPVRGMILSNWHTVPSVSGEPYLSNVDPGDEDGYGSGI